MAPIEICQKTTENSAIITVYGLGLGLGTGLGLVFRVRKWHNGANVHRNLPKTTKKSVIITVEDLGLGLGLGLWLGIVYGGLVRVSV